MLLKTTDAIALPEAQNTELPLLVRTCPRTPKPPFAITALTVTLLLNVCGAVKVKADEVFTVPVGACAQGNVPVVILVAFVFIRCYPEITVLLVSSEAGSLFVYFFGAPVIHIVAQRIH